MDAHRLAAEHEHERGTHVVKVESRDDYRRRGMTARPRHPSWIQFLTTAGYEWPTRPRRSGDLAIFRRALYILSYWSVNRIWQGLTVPVPPRLPVAENHRSQLSQTKAVAEEREGEPGAVALVEILRRVQANPYHWPVGRTTFQ